MYLAHKTEADNQVSLRVQSFPTIGTTITIILLTLLLAFLTALLTSLVAGQPSAPPVARLVPPSLRVALIPLLPTTPTG